MPVPKHCQLGGWYPWGRIVHQQRYRPSNSNENVDIKFSVHDAFIDQPSFGTLKIERLKSHIT
jgi:hypothetical protein